MTLYIVRRLLWAVLMLLAVSALTFVIFYTLPSADPAALRAGRQATPELIAQIRHSLGLDRPVYDQFFIYMKNFVLHFNLGYSYQNNISVRAEIASRLPATLSLTAGAVFVWMLIGIPVGVLSAIKPRSLLDRVAMGASLVGISAPVYWLGLVALFLFASDIGRIHLFGGAGSYVSITHDPRAWFSSLILPWFVLAASFAAFYARMVRGNLLEVMGEDYIRTARAKGVSERRVIVRHGLRAALTPVVTIIGLQFGAVLTGTIITETIFAWPGLGRLVVQAIDARDYPLVQGCVLAIAASYVVVNTATDLLQRAIDPRIGDAP